MSTYTQPFFPFLLICTVAGVVAYRKRPTPKFVVVLALALFFFCWQPTAGLALLALEAGYPQRPPSDHAVQAIVVLSSQILPPVAPRTTAILGPDTYERCMYAAWLYQHWNAVPVLASGGARPEAPYSIVMREALERQGVPATMIWTEEDSRSTYENAVNSARILRQKGIRKIALVTEAYHMPRALKCFRKQGLEVVPAACGFRGGFPRGLHDFIPNPQAGSWNEDSLHEALGLLWYQVSGKV
jgi:uncharacterized SAM-binding protein YcdF (DUF218 family)